MTHNVSCNHFINPRVKLQGIQVRKLKLGVTDFTQNLEAASFNHKFSKCACKVSRVRLSAGLNLEDKLIRSLPSSG